MILVDLLDVVKTGDGPERTVAGVFQVVNRGFVAQAFKEEVGEDFVTQNESSRDRVVSAKGEGTQLQI